MHQGPGKRGEGKGKERRRRKGRGGGGEKQLKVSEWETQVLKGTRYKGRTFYIQQCFAFCFLQY
jgi:hypothetical protein